MTTVLDYSITESEETERLWGEAITTWARNATSRRIVLRCAQYEQRGLALLMCQSSREKQTTRL